MNADYARSIVLEAVLSLLLVGLGIYLGYQLALEPGRARPRRPCGCQDGHDAEEDDPWAAELAGRIVERMESRLHDPGAPDASEGSGDTSGAPGGESDGR